jgi:hypothetical protein
MWWGYDIPSLHAVLGLAKHMPCHHACNFWACGTCIMPSLHAVAELVGHMPCHHYMQVWSIWGRCHAIIKCNFRAYETYDMHSAITSYWFILVCIIMYYFIMLSTLSLIGPTSPTPWCLQGMHHVIIICSLGPWVGTCHILITCSSRACDAYAMPSLHVVAKLMAHMPCPHYMQFWSLYGICHATILCNSGIYWAYGMLLWNAMVELMIHMSCPPVIASYCFVMLYIMAYYFVLRCDWLHSKPYRYDKPYTLGPLRHVLCPSLHMLLELGGVYVIS